MTAGTYTTNDLVGEPTFRTNSMEKRTLLIVDDSADDRATLIGHFNRDANFEYRVIRAARIAEGLQERRR